MAGFNDVHEIAAWQLAHKLSLRVDLFLYSPEFRRHYRFCQQLGDAARSGPKHIAEGHARFTHTEFAALVRVAREAEARVLDHLVEAHGQRLITADELAINKRLAKRAMKAASGLIRYLESTTERVTSGTG
jgi:four helix bundle protein